MTCSGHRLAICGLPVAVLGCASDPPDVVGRWVTLDDPIVIIQFFEDGRVLGFDEDSRLEWGAYRVVRAGELEVDFEGDRFTMNYWFEGDTLAYVIPGDPGIIRLELLSR